MHDDTARLPPPTPAHPPGAPAGGLLRPPAPELGHVIASQLKPQAQTRQAMRPWGAPRTSLSFAASAIAAAPSTGTTNFRPKFTVFRGFSGVLEAAQYLARDAAAFLSLYAPNYQKMSRNVKNCHIFLPNTVLREQGLSLVQNRVARLARSAHFCDQK